MLFTILKNTYLLFIFTIFIIKAAIKETIEVESPINKINEETLEECENKPL